MMKTAMMLSIEPDVKPLGLGGDFEKNVRLIAGLGFNGAELTVKNPGQIDARKVRRIAEDNHVIITSMTPGPYYFAQPSLSMSTSDRELRKKAVEGLKKFIRLNGELSSNLVVGIAQGKYDGGYEEGFKWLKDSLQECAKLAEKLGILILVEPINRYRGGVIRTISEGIRIIDELGSPSVKLVADTHHMNIEEKSMTDSIRQAKGYLAHMHFADSNRLAPGQGHIDFYKIAEALRDIGYEGFVSAEILPEPEPETAAKLAIEYMRSLPY